MKKAIFTIDVEPGIIGIVESLKTIEKIFSKHKIKPVLFVTCQCLEKYPKIFQKLKKQDYEINLHGYKHERFDILNKKQKQEILKKAVSVYKKIFRRNPKAFRAPQFSADFELLELLEKYDFKYDSSIMQFPISQIIFFPGRFSLYLKQFKFTKKIKEKNMKIREIPVSSFIFPISMFSLRILPVFLFNLLANLTIFFRKDKKLVFLAHSYEFKNNKLLNKLEKFLKKWQK